MAIKAMTDTGKIVCEMQQLGGPHERFSGTKAAKQLF
jgi:hypothetical protein